jgi:hypothetical protein
MIFALPVVGWILGFVFYALLSIPTYFLWNGLAPTYFPFLPQLWLKIPFWDMVWLFCLLSIVRSFVFPISTSTEASASASVDRKR